MKRPPVCTRASRLRILFALRACVSLVLLAVLAMGIVPVRYGEHASLACGGDGDRGVRIEPLQVCGSEDPLLGGLFDVPVLPPTAPAVVPSSAALPLARSAAAFAPDGFRPAIDHPPQHAA